MLLNESDKSRQGNGLAVVSIDKRDDLSKLKAIGLDKLLPQLLNGSVVFYFLFEELGQFSLAVILQKFISRHQSTANTGALHMLQVLGMSVSEIKRVSV